MFLTYITRVNVLHDAIYFCAPSLFRGCGVAHCHKILKLRRIQTLFKDYRAYTIQILRGKITLPFYLWKRKKLIWCLRVLFFWRCWIKFYRRLIVLKIYTAIDSYHLCWYHGPQDHFMKLHSDIVSHLSALWLILKVNPFLEI